MGHSMPLGDLSSAATDRAETPHHSPSLGGTAPPPRIREQCPLPVGKGQVGAGGACGTQQCGSRKTHLPQLSEGGSYPLMSGKSGFPLEA